MNNNNNNFISPVGYVEQDNDYSVTNKNVRSRESLDPKTDLSFYFKTYIVPKYGLNNINVSNCASFMKDLEMNWNKLDNNLKDKVLDIMVDDIFNNSDSFDFKNRLLKKLEINININNDLSTTKKNNPNFKSNVGMNNDLPTSKFTETSSKESFGNSGKNNVFIYLISFVLLFLIIFFIDKYFKNK